MGLFREEIRHDNWQLFFPVGELLYLFIRLCSYYIFKSKIIQQFYDLVVEKSGIQVDISYLKLDCCVIQEFLDKSFPEIYLMDRLCPDCKPSPLYDYCKCDEPKIMESAPVRLSFNNIVVIFIAVIMHVMEVYCNVHGPFEYAKLPCNFECVPERPLEHCQYFFLVKLGYVP